MRRELREAQKRLPLVLTECRIPPHLVRPNGPQRVWRSQRLLVQGYDEPSMPSILIRLSINVADVDKNGEWFAGLGWDELQRIKRECGFGDFDAVEIFPRESQVVNVANMRHLWVYREPLQIGWRR